ncbi:hypothetical protein CONLIGDRAFT_585244, partial [Coniochaeta ligniaria NRRL 30616]
FPSPARKSDFLKLRIGHKITIHGFLSRKRIQHSKLVFADVTGDYIPMTQITSALSEEEGPAYVANKDLRATPLHSPVAVTGVVKRIRLHKGPEADKKPRILHLEMDLESIQVLNPFPKDIIVSKGAKFPPSSRHLQIRFSEALRHRLIFRGDVMRLCQGLLKSVGFRQMETPMLFKSTPEGAREFLVPTRRKGFAYALPQSPQQYKQLLMASGIFRYFQFARCFRDEDLRADRQPEFTQLDLEMSFVTGEDVMQTVESMVRTLLHQLFKERYTMTQLGDELVPVLAQLRSRKTRTPEFWEEQRVSAFPRLTYEQAMKNYGSDKPDLRIPFNIQQIDPSILPQSFISMVTDLQNPIIEAIKLRPADNETLDTDAKRRFILKFMDNLPAALSKNPDGAPAVLVVDSSKPMNGLSSLGHEGFANLTSLEAFSDLTDGDIIILQARPNVPFHGGSTPLGNIRTLLYNEAVTQGLLPKDNTFKFLWVTEFPMFTPDADKDADPGQGGSAGFSATHHPFTAPLTDADFDLLATDPLKAKADHYDLVVNGVELGGGSRRIHVAKVQEYVMRDILRMTDAGVAQFAHLLEALRAGCPPHAGFAMGFDRFVAVLSGTSSVRDVIAFPKSMKGEDLMVKAPGKVTAEQLATYHLQLDSKVHFRKIVNNTQTP